MCKLHISSNNLCHELHKFPRKQGKIRVIRGKKSSLKPIIRRWRVFVILNFPGFAPKGRRAVNLDRFAADVSSGRR
jgi:hypothetical protein